MNRYDLPAFVGALLVCCVMFAPIVPLVILDMVMSLVADVLDLSGNALRSTCRNDMMTRLLVLLLEGQSQLWAQHVETRGGLAPGGLHPTERLNLAHQTGWWSRLRPWR
jgi:hypothetical protein